MAAEAYNAGSMPEPGPRVAAGSRSVIVRAPASSSARMPSGTSRMYGSSVIDLSLKPVSEDLLAEELARVKTAWPAHADLLELLATFVRTADDAELVRINPVRFAQERGLARADVVDLFLHARKVGLLTMEWQYVCPGCGDVVERLPSLTSATAHYFCQVCSADRDADLSDFIEVTFSVAPEVRRSRYHDPWSLDPDEHFLRYRFSESAVVDDGTPLRDYLRGTSPQCAYIQPGATEAFKITAEPGMVWMTNGPALIVGDGRTTEERTFDFEYTGTRSEGFRADIAAGPVEIAFTNATDEPYALMINKLPSLYDVAMQPFLSGAELLSNQTFLDLFESETIVAGEGLAVKRLALLFTDLQGSTALYERIGDMKAFDLVRQHFGELRDAISRNSGAMVKTIGDAVMASFVDPLDALRAALEMRTRLAAFNRGVGEDQVVLKIGLHFGACLAVTLNDRLDYFGQTVNIAARVQALAGANEIVVTDDVMSVAGALELVERGVTEIAAVELRGVAGQIRVHYVRSPTVTDSADRGRRS
jgi:class 3 adenylate cyclase